MRPPDFDDTVGGDVHYEERERLRRAHDLLVAAGPAPELPAALADPPLPRPARRSAVARVLPLAAALSVAAFAGGYLAGAGRQEAFETDFVLTMEATPFAPTASATLRVGEIDDAGNWPMEMTVDGLRPGPRYELFLTRGGRPAASCGYFTVEAGRTTVYLNAPYRLKAFDGWAVTREGSAEVLLRGGTA